MVEQLGGKPMLKAFRKEMLPHLRRSAGKNMSAPISEAEYQYGIEQISRELPAFRQYLLTANLNN